MTIAATAAAARPNNDGVLRPEATLVVCCAGGAAVLLASVPELDPPEPLEGEIGVLPLELEPGACPGLKFSAAWAASATKACIVLLPDAGLSMC